MPSARAPISDTTHGDAAPPTTETGRAQMAGPRRTPRRARRRRLRRLARAARDERKWKRYGLRHLPGGDRPRHVGRRDLNAWQHASATQPPVASLAAAGTKI